MESAVKPQSVFIVHISALPCHPNYVFKNILSKAEDFYKSIIPTRSFYAHRDDLTNLDQVSTWANLCFSSQDDAVKCAQWLLHGPISLPGAPPSFHGVRVLKRVQASPTDLERAANEAREYEKNLIQWQAAADASAMDLRSVPSLDPGNSRDATERGRDRGRERTRDRSRRSDSDSPPRRNRPSPTETRPKSASGRDTTAPPAAAVPKSKPAVSLFPSKKAPQEKPSEARGPVGQSSKPAVPAKPVEPPPPDGKKIEIANRLIREALCHGMSKEKIEEAFLMASELSHRIMESVLALELDFKKFVDKVRQLSSNLHQNHDLRGKVLDGRTSPDALVHMNSVDMQTKEKAEWKRGREEKSMLESMVDPNAVGSWHNTAAALQMKRAALGEHEMSPSLTLDRPNSQHSNDLPVQSSLRMAAPGKNSQIEPEASIPLEKPLNGGPTTTNLLDYSLPLSPRVAQQSGPSPPADAVEGAPLPQHAQQATGVGPSRPVGIYKRPSGELPETFTRPYKSVRFDPSVKNEEESEPMLGYNGNEIFGDASRAPPATSNFGKTTTSSLSLYIPPDAAPTNTKEEQNPTVFSTISSLPHIAWGPPSPSLSPDWQPPQVLQRNLILNGKLAWNEYEVDVEGVGFSPSAFIRLPGTIRIEKMTSIEEMTESIRETGAQPWHVHRFWLVGPSMPTVDWAMEPEPYERIVGRVLVNIRGEVLNSNNEGWEKGPHGWEIFIMVSFHKYTY